MTYQIWRTIVNPAFEMTADYVEGDELQDVMVQEYNDYNEALEKVLDLGDRSILARIIEAGQ